MGRELRRTLVHLPRATPAGAAAGAGAAGAGAGAGAGAAGADGAGAGGDITLRDTLFDTSPDA